MYKVIKHFHDLQDVTKTKGGVLYYEYNVGDIYPREGLEVSEERLAELSGENNKQGAPLIELVEERDISEAGNQAEGQPADFAADAEKEQPAKKTSAKRTTVKTSAE